MSIREPPLQTTWNTPPYRVLSAALKFCHNIAIIPGSCSQMVRRHGMDEGEHLLMKPEATGSEPIDKTIGIVPAVPAARAE